MSRKRAVRDHLPGLDDADVGAELRQLVQDVRRDDDRLPHRLQFLQQLAHLDARPRIEPAGRLIEQQQVGIVQKHAREPEPLLHPARKPIDRRVLLSRQIRQRQHIVDERARFAEGIL